VKIKKHVYANGIFQLSVSTLNVQNQLYFTKQYANSFWGRNLWWISGSVSQKIYFSQIYVDF